MHIQLTKVSKVAYNIVWIRKSSDLVLKEDTSILIWIWKLVSTIVTPARRVWHRSSNFCCSLFDSLSVKNIRENGFLCSINSCECHKSMLSNCPQHTV